MARDPRYDRFYVMDKKCEVFAYCDETDETISFGFSTRAEYLEGIEEFDRSTRDVSIFRYTMWLSSGERFEFDAGGAETGMVREVVLDNLEEIAMDLD